MTDVLTLETPAGPGTVEFEPGDGLVLLTHGAGGGVHSPDLDAVRDALRERGIGVGLVTQPYRVAGRRAPPRPGAQDEAWLALLAALRTRPDVTASGPLVVGGRSNGARVACRTAPATGAVAVVALAFPLHPPGHPEKTRLDELDHAGVPVLVVQGERDPFGRPPAAAGRRVVVVAGDHALKADASRVANEVAVFVAQELRSQSGTGPDPAG